MVFYRRNILTPGEKLKRRLLLATFLFILFTFFVTRAYFSDTVKSYTANRAKLQISVLVNDAISREIVPNIDTDELIRMKTNADGYVTDVFIDVYQINLLLTQMIRDIQIHLEDYITRDILTLPFGVVFGHPWFSSMGPHIPIEIKMMGNVFTDIITRTERLGINNTLMEVMIKTEINVLVIIPFQQEEIQVVTTTPLVITLIHGQIPRYYYSNRESSEFIHPPFGG